MRISHLSDLHFGAHDEAVARALASDVRDQKPDLVVVSGDFTQIGSRSEFESARAFLDVLRLPVFAVPGNHDLPVRNLLLRMLDPYGRYRRYVAADLEPVLDLGEVVLVGIKTPRRMRLDWNWANGSISRGQLERTSQRFAESLPGAVRVVVAHHPLLHPEEAMARPMQLVKRAEEALEVFSALGVRLVLSGHFHRSYTRRHLAIDPLGSNRPAEPLIVAQAASAISTRLRDEEKNGYNIIDIISGEISITLRRWSGTNWHQ